MGLLGDSAGHVIRTETAAAAGNVRKKEAKAGGTQKKQQPKLLQKVMRNVYSIKICFF